MSESPAVLYERRGHIGLITLNRPDNRNSMTPELLDAFAGAVSQAKADAELRCVVITGKGRCFSAGADFKSNIQIEGGEGFVPPHERSFAMYSPFLSVLDIEVPVIGALNGHTVGGGFGLSLVTDIRIGNVGSKYGANFAKLGLHPGMAISWLLPRLIGVQQAAEMLFTGRLILGDEALRLGLVSQAVPTEDVFDTAWAVAEQIAANAPLAVRMMKRTFYEGLSWEPKKAAFQEAWAQAVTVDTADAKEGMAALLEKRTPVFLGR
ncbi:MAG: enoyl-CoA hydratase/isomerase family protein [Myxococcales bacterium]|nr:enoyl-CoA hydratase/isomerase family protein [Myxococcales bacterium]